MKFRIINFQYIFLALTTCTFLLILPKSESIKTNQIFYNPLPQYSPETMDVGLNKECLCAKTFKCRPCNVIATVNDQFLLQPECPCAKCPICPKISLVHELSAKKAMQDQGLAARLKNVSNKMNQYYDLLIKYSNDVVKYENEAKAKSLLMEEAEIKAMLARKNMVNMSERARFIAKMGIVDRVPCFGPGCDESNSMFGQKEIFPEEVSSVKDYITTSLNSNIPVDNLNELDNGMNNGLSNVENLQPADCQNSQENSAGNIEFYDNNANQFESQAVTTNTN